METLMTEAKDMNRELELLKLYIGTAESVSERRSKANVFSLSVNSALTSLYGFLKAGEEAIGSDTNKSIWLLAIPVAGILACLAWDRTLDSYRKLNAAKFATIIAFEQRFGTALFADEREHYKKEKRRALASTERIVPISFMLMYICFVLTAVASIAL
jgi:hypothetical protein